jgi:GH25 family lysozyme M1 (1,4-beta-N-acetylmuramidase)
MIKGADLSHWNSEVDYQMMKDAGVRFTCIKLGQGMLPKDTMFDTHRIGCEHVNVPWDIYWFCDYRYSGASNVAQLISKAAGNYGMGHVVEDLEFFDAWGPRPDGLHMLRFSQDFFRSLEVQTKIVGTLYTNRDVLNQMWAAATSSEKIEMARHLLWFASDDETPEPTHLPIELNQYDLDVGVPWSHGTVDWDDFMGTEDQFATWKGIAPPPVLTLEQRIYNLEVEVHKLDNTFNP